VVLGIWAIEIGLGALYRRSGRQGPVEALWRRLAR
jgi:uncharacterized membrane protein YeiB